VQLLLAVGRGIRRHVEHRPCALGVVAAHLSFRSQLKVALAVEGLDEE
jgi:hypothetical protein